MKPFQRLTRLVLRNCWYFVVFLPLSRDYRNTSNANETSRAIQLHDVPKQFLFCHSTLLSLLQLCQLYVCALHSRNSTCDSKDFAASEQYVEIAKFNFFVNYGFSRFHLIYYGKSPLQSTLSFSVISTFFTPSEHWLPIHYKQIMFTVRLHLSGSQMMV